MHQRVLIVGTIPYNRQTSSRAFESYFSNWEKDNLAQIFSNPREPVHGHCGTFYQITDHMMLKKRFKPSTMTGTIYYDEDLKDEWDPQVDSGKKSIISKLYGLGSRKFPLNYLLRGWLWKKEYWCTDTLNKWLDDFSPECVFLAFSDDFFIPRIALYVAERYNIPIVSCIGDDYYFNDSFSLSPFYYIYRKKYKILINKIFSHGGSAAYIGNKIRDKYNSEFKLDGDTVYLTSEIKRHEFRPINLETPFISYCGNIRLGRDESLCAIATALGKINNNYVIHVYSNETEEQFTTKLKHHPNVSYHEAIPYKEVIEVIQKSDILVVVEGFKKKDVDITRYSLSTKVPDSLASGGNIITVGSIECGAIEYMQQIDCGPVCTDISQLKEDLYRLMNDLDYQKRNYYRCIEVTNRNHTLEASNSKFEKIVSRAIKEFGVM